MFSFPEALQLGMKRIDQMESEKVSLEGQISQRTVKFEDVLLRRNVEIQKEYKRSLRKLDLEMDVLNQAIEQKRRSSKRLRPCSSFDTDTIGQKKHKNLKEVLRRLTERVQLLQEEHTQLGLRDENMATAELDDAEQKVLLEEKLADLQKEAVLVEDDNEVSLHSVKDISEPENFAASVEEDIDQTRCLIRSVNTQIHSQRTRLLSLLRTLAPTASIGSLMVRLYQQLMKTPEEIDVTSDLKKVARQTVELRQFLQNCPDTSDGQRAIELMQKLRLVYAYESSEKPSDVKHNGSSVSENTTIYGIDGHPHKNMFATAGGDNCVKLWSLSPPTVSTQKATRISDFELLATLSDHQQAVNCVRWAKHGLYLASGSDDRLILLYKMKPGIASCVAFGSKQIANKQNWVCFATLKSHTMGNAVRSFAFSLRKEDHFVHSDVQDLAWSPDDRMLASCSIDNTILIWNVDPSSIQSIMSNPIRTLSGHNGWVKGIAWDPIGKYLSSSGEDKSVRLWNTDSWEETEILTEPFESCASSSHFRRLCWSPDGSVLCATHAFSSKQNVAALFNRTTWTNELNLVGHKGVVTTCRFNRQLFRACGTEKDHEYACCAVGSDDATISIWLAKLARPLVVVTECFQACVTDLTWSKDGYILLASSLDGSVCCFQFNESEIGKPIAGIEQSRILQTRYGAHVGNTQINTLIENPMQLQMEEQESDSTKQNGIFTEQIFVSDTKPQVNLLQPVSKRHKVNLNQGTYGQCQSIVHDPVATREQKNASNTLTTQISPVDQAERIHTTSTTSDSVQEKEIASADKNVVSNVSQRKRNRNDNSVRRKQLQNSTKARDIVPRSSKCVPGESRTALLSPIPLRLSFSIEIFANKLETRFLSNDSKQHPLNIEITVHNLKVEDDDNLIARGPIYTTLRCHQESQTQWMDRLPGRGVCGTGNAFFCAFGLDGGQIFILSLRGQRLFPCIAIDSAISVMECSRGNSDYLLVISTSGKLHVWNIRARKKLLTESIDSVIGGENGYKMTLLRCQITSRGMPIITITKSTRDGKGPSTLENYIFDKNMESWMRVTDASFIFSDFSTSLPTNVVSGNNAPMKLLRQLQTASGYARSQRGIPSAMLSEMTDPYLQRNLTRSHLEHQIAACRVLESQEEYQYWLTAYAKFLAQDEDLSRLDELCIDLLGPVHAQNDRIEEKESGSWDPFILGMSRRELLRNSILPSIASNRTMQRLVAKFQLLLREADGVLEQQHTNS
ncbi:unnamed protein product [Albugo candida]|uniref:Uncharacterized protein n=1 Tax=Albugo candida TaxID=65357 RepID=A0A024GHG8_9STRA|nr:unnamed protein product [Albugo candida]|eukprot:CCI46150.1 unnamed protein product [Albugo candida]